MTSNSTTNLALLFTQGATESFSTGLDTIISNGSPVAPLYRSIKSIVPDHLDEKAFVVFLRLSLFYEAIYYKPMSMASWDDIDNLISLKTTSSDKITEDHFFASLYATFNSALRIHTFSDIKMINPDELPAIKTALEPLMVYLVCLMSKHYLPNKWACLSKDYLS